MSLLGDLIRNLFTKPSTVLFPTEKLPVPECFRGRVRFTEEKCIGCSRCALVCPAQCITMVADQKEIEVKGRKITRKKRPRIKVLRCIRCGLCEDACPSEAIRLTREFSVSGPECEVEEA
jgi:formate hydrogenlyase subunit 6/NADH:ubiquinone oxidoreductase subunit I